MSKNKELGGKLMELMSRIDSFEDYSPFKRLKINLKALSLINKNAELNDNYNVVNGWIYETSPLQNAAAKGWKKIAKALIKKGADINLRNSKNNYTALDYAIKHNQHEIVSLLIKAGADLSSSLNTAVYHKNTTAVKMLLENGADVNAKNSTMPIHHVKDLEMLKILVNAGADINTTSKDKSTALHYVVSNGNMELAKYLIEKGADVNAQNQDGTTPLMCAAETVNTLQMCDLLIKSGADINLQNREGMTALMYAAEIGRTDFCSLFIKSGADVNLKNTRQGHTALYYAIKNTNRDLVENLINAGANINEPECGMTYLQLALRRENFWDEMSKSRISHNELHNDSVFICRLLLEAGADIDENTIECTDDLYLKDMIKHFKDKKLKETNNKNTMEENLEM